MREPTTDDGRRRPDRRLNRLNARFDVRAANPETGEFSGWAMVFGNQDDYGTIFDRGCFTESLAEHAARGAMPAMLWQHNWDQVVGRWTKMEEREGGPLGTGGLYVEGRTELKTQLGREAIALLAADPTPALDGISIGFTVAGYEKKEDVWHYTKVKLWEASIVTFPAQDYARVERALAADDIRTERDLEDVLRDAGLSRSEALAVASRFKPKADTPRDAAGAEDERAALQALAQIFS